MCGRNSITLPPEAIRQLFQTHGELPNWPAYYARLPVVRQAATIARDGLPASWEIDWHSPRN
jgi:hypothetical protein